MDPELLNDDDIDNEDILLKAEEGLAVPNTKVNSENNEEPKPLNVDELTNEQERTSTYYIIYQFLSIKFHFTFYVNMWLFFYLEGNIGLESNYNENTKVYDVKEVPSQLTNSSTNYGKMIFEDEFSYLFVT